jgi:ABC-2 type transport system ATP-binding protein
VRKSTIRTEDLSRRFGSVNALDGLSIQVEPGTVFGFLGPNGAGKTTTIRLMLGLLEPTRGRCEVFGLDASTHGDEVRQRVGALLEHTGLHERMSAEENLEFYARVWRMDPPERRDRIREVLTGIDLWERREDLVEGWSRGMRQKLALGRALLHRPEMVFLDEPTAGLDVVSAAVVREQLAELVAREGTTVFLTTHNMAEAEQLCDHVGVIRDGRLLAMGRPADLKASSSTTVEVTGSGFTDEIVRLLRARKEVAGVTPERDTLRIDLTGDEETAPLITMLVAAGAQVEQVHRGKASLEEVFLALMNEDSAISQPGEEGAAA